MSNLKKYNVIGIMSGTSMDSADFSFIRTDGVDYVRVIYEKNYNYSDFYKKKLKKLINDLPSNKKNKIIYSKKNEDFITKRFTIFLKNFIKIIKLQSKEIDLIGLSGQTIFHNPNRKYSIQLGCGKKIYQKIKIPIVTNFRDRDLSNGGQGAPIGSFYHKFILKKINKNACIINLGGIANITFIKKKLISYDLGPSNALIDDLSYYFYKKNYDRNGIYASKGKLINKIFHEFKKNIFFKKKFPKSLDRNHFYFYYEKLKKYKANDAIHTATIMTIYGILAGLKLNNENIDLIILTGGGRKNLFLQKKLKQKLTSKKISTKNIEIYGYNGDMIESQMFGYLAVRSLKKLHLSLPSTTGVKKAISGGVLNGKLIKN